MWKLRAFGRKHETFERYCRCPFCFNTFSTTKALYRCLHPDCVVDDNLLARHLGLGQRLEGSVFGVEDPVGSYVGLNPFSSLATVRCKRCNKPTSQRVCPRCHSDLPPGFDRVEPVVIAVVGACNSGKTSYIATAVDALEKNAYRFNMDFRPQGTDTVVNFNTHYRPLLEAGALPESTQVNGDNLVVRQPLLYRLEFRDVPRDDEISSSHRSATLVLFDSAGESFDDPRCMALHSRGLVRADGVIFVVDPLILPGIFAKLREEHQDSAKQVSVGPQNIVDNIVELFESKGVISSEDRITVPTAFVFSKGDVLARQAELMPDSEFWRGQASMAESEFSSAMSSQLSNRIQAVLGSDLWGGQVLLNKIRKFETRKFFIASSLGVPPEGTDPVPVAKPVGVLEPLLWILSTRGYLTWR